MARKTKLTTEVEEKIARAIRGGCTYRVAAGLAGISESTFYSWMESGKVGKGQYAKLVAAVEQANSELQAKLTLQFSMAGERDWRAARDFLRRRWPADWGEDCRRCREREQEAKEHSPREGMDPQTLADPKVREASANLVAAVGDARRRNGVDGS